MGTRFASFILLCTEPSFKLSLFSITATLANLELRITGNLSPCFFAHLCQSGFIQWEIVSENGRRKKWKWFSFPLSGLLGMFPFPILSLLWGSSTYAFLSPMNRSKLLKSAVTFFCFKERNRVGEPESQPNLMRHLSF